jgi:hypothetical protein
MCELETKRTTTVRIINIDSRLAIDDEFISLTKEIDVTWNFIYGNDENGISMGMEIITKEITLTLKSVMTEEQITRTFKIDDSWEVVLKPKKGFGSTVRANLQTYNYSGSLEHLNEDQHPTFELGLSPHHINVANKEIIFEIAL